MSGFGSVGAIPYIEILSFLELIAKIDDPEEQATFIELIEHLDTKFLNDFAEKQKQEQAKTKAKKPGARSKPSS
jgi:hypothetical protein